MLLQLVLQVNAACKDSQVREMKTPWAFLTQLCLFPPPLAPLLLLLLLHSFSCLCTCSDSADSGFGLDLSADLGFTQSSSSALGAPPPRRSLHVHVNNYLLLLDL